MSADGSDSGAEADISARLVLSALAIKIVTDVAKSSQPAANDRHRWADGNRVASGDISGVTPSAEWAAVEAEALLLPPRNLIAVRRSASTKRHCRLLP